MKPSKKNQSLQSDTADNLIAEAEQLAADQRYARTVLADDYFDCDSELEAR